MLTRHVDVVECTGGSQANDYAICPLLLLVLLKCRTVKFSAAKYFLFYNRFHDLITGIVMLSFIPFLASSKHHSYVSEQLMLPLPNKRHRTTK